MHYNIKCKYLIHYLLTFKDINMYMLITYIIRSRNFASNPFEEVIAAPSIDFFHRHGKLFLKYKNVKLWVSVGHMEMIISPILKRHNFVSERLEKKLLPLSPLNMKILTTTLWYKLYRALWPKIRCHTTQDPVSKFGSLVVFVAFAAFSQRFPFNIFVI